MSLGQAALGAPFSGFGDHEVFPVVEFVERNGRIFSRGSQSGSTRSTPGAIRVS